ncbi:uncharacterized protein LOC123270949 [Cotesia glomerata]|uniref:uncharacterized protein LOC123270949 n=1 Tax=Cotesia glomerata TaxID=32391 RepID=UPI001D0259B0|nr:uncharacterized protein LOC123270949 [Cotesia glomerata]
MSSSETSVMSDNDEEGTDYIQADTCLVEKVILILGFCGAMRCKELSLLNHNDVEYVGSKFIVSVRDTKNYYPRSFVIMNKYYHLVKKYIALRPKNCTSEKFFLCYRNGRCIRQLMGKIKICIVPQKIARFLNLPDPEGYTGHCFRRTSTTLLANSGASLTTIKQHGGWRSSSVAEGYIENSLQNKTRIFNKIINSENQQPLHEKKRTPISSNESASQKGSTFRRFK